jgi:hypothetical protein
MEKLIELLREYIRPKYEYWEYWVYLNKQNKLILEEQHSFMGYWLDEERYTDVEFWESIIISKKFWFIKWLVENDKIDRHKFYDKNILKWFMTLTKEEKSDSIIMNLSISDTPIEFLISILKNV